jgi:hypothetical protein
MRRSIQEGTCFYGPFKGEYGHFLAHTLPFLMYLHKHGVKIIYCGMGIHKALLVDESGASIVSEFIELRDFFSEVAPNTNSTIPPSDVQDVIVAFASRAIASGLPFWNIDDDHYYWFIHRMYTVKRFHYVYDLSKSYKTKNENAVCIFPRNKGAAYSHNNGGPWDYGKMIANIEPYFDKVYIVGHPSQSLTIVPSAKTEFRITADNAIILEACANSQLIITQHSGVNNLGEYLNRQVLIIYNGGKRVADIGSMNNTLLFRNYLNEKIPLQFAFTEDEITNYVKNFTCGKNHK